MCEHLRIRLKTKYIKQKSSPLTYVDMLVDKESLTFRISLLPLHSYLLTLWSRVLLEKLTGLQLVKKFPVFFGTPRFITAFTSSHHVSLSGATTSYFLKIHLNIMLTFTPGSPQWSLSFRFSHQNPVHSPPLHHTR
jgi:hypothetical protein